jgi:hypothetical protein
MSVVALFAALFEDSVKRLELEQMPATLANGPSYPNVLRFFDLPQLVALAFPRAINLTNADPGDWEWSLKAAKLLEGTITFSQGKTASVPGVVIDYSPALSRQYKGIANVTIFSTYQPTGVIHHEFL